MNNPVSYSQLQVRKLPKTALLLAHQSVLIPLYFFVPIWIALLNSVAFGLVVYAEHNPRFVIGRVLKVVITSLAIIGIYLVFEKFSGREAGIALITSMYGLKILETNKIRDANLLMNLGFFMIVAGFLFSQKLPIAIYQLVPVVLILNALISIQRISRPAVSPATLMKSSVSSTRYLLYALPIMIVLFLFFPRLGGPIWRMPSGSSAMSGVSDSMGPGEISNLQLSNEIAFRVKFEQEAPKTSAMYWRVLTLSSFDGFTWTRNPLPPVELPELNVQSLPLYNYAITLEPTRAKYLVTLEHAVNVPDQSRYLADFTAYANYRLLDRTRYSGSSSLSLKLDAPLTEQERASYTRLPQNGNSQTREWALQQRALVSNDQYFIDRVLKEINQQEYHYTLQPPIMDEDTVDSFWMNYKRGFCEHYAGAFVFLARAAGIPARVVIGYQGAEKNSLSDYWIVRYANAHAWTEVWLEGQGWVRIDPTAAIAPHRVEPSLLADYSQRDSLFDEFDVVDLDDHGFFKALRDWSDQMNNSWNEWVLDYDGTRQNQFFSNWGFDDISKTQLVISMFIVLFVFVVLLSFKWLRDRTALDPVAAGFLKLNQFLLKNGMQEVTDATGPMDLLTRLNQLRDPKMRAAAKALKLYIQIQYAGKAGNPQLVKDWLFQVAKLR